MRWGGGGGGRGGDGHSRRVGTALLLSFGFKADHLIWLRNL